MTIEIRVSGQPVPAMAGPGAEMVSKHFLERLMKVYLSGAMTGIPNYNRPKFAEAANKLRIDGHEVFNPAAANLESWPLRKIFEYELSWICREAEAIALIPGWENSKGVAAELATAKAIGLEIIQL